MNLKYYYFPQSRPVLSACLGMFWLSSPVLAQSEAGGDAAKGRAPSAFEPTPTTTTGPTAEPASALDRADGTPPVTSTNDRGEVVPSSEVSEEALETTPENEPPAAANEPVASRTSDNAESTPTAAAPNEEKPYDGPATLLEGGEGKLHIGGFGGVVVHGTSINNSAGVLVGAEGALLLDHRFALGVAGYGLASEVRGPDYENKDESVLGFGYGGATFRYHLLSPKSPVSLSVGSLIGAGGLTLGRKIGEDDFEFDIEEGGPAIAVFVLEPTLQLHLHLTRWMRVGVGGGYRFVFGPKLGEITATDLQGVTAGGHIQFGWF